MPKTRMKRVRAGDEVLSQVLRAAHPRPDAKEAEKEEKIQYAVRFADAMAKYMAHDLAIYLPGVIASPKREAQAAKGGKQLDVNYSTPQLGLGVGVSLKSVHLRDAKKNRKTGSVTLGRFTHNMKRNEEELRVEASGYHKRQPYAVMVGLLFLPFESCNDAKGKGHSSFGGWVRHLRPLCKRSGPHDEIDKFERIYIGLYEPNGSDLGFFDVSADPPKNGKPKKMATGEINYRTSPQHLLTYQQCIYAIYDAYLQRNDADFEWADGESEPLTEDELVSSNGEDSDE